jgi:hypothetical protein
VAGGTKLSVVVKNCVLVYIVVSVMCSACYFLINPQRGCEALCGDGTAAMLLGYGVHPLIPTGTRVNVKQRQQNSVPSLDSRNLTTQQNVITNANILPLFTCQCGLE